MPIGDDVVAAAAWMATALTSSGYRADYSPVSLHDIDRFFDEQTLYGVARKRGLLAEGVGQRLFGLGAYVGEVIRRGVGGMWTGDDADPAAEINVSLVLADGTVIWPMQRVIKRFSNGGEDSIVAYASSLGLSSIGVAPSASAAAMPVHMSGRRPQPSGDAGTRRGRPQSRNAT